MNAFFFLLTACFWAGSFIAIQPLVHAVPPLTAGALRLGVGFSFLTLLFPVLKIKFSLLKEARRDVWITGLFAFALPMALLFWGEKSISPGLAGILNGTVPIWVFILGLIFTPRAEPITLKTVTGLLAGIFGVVAIFITKILASESDPSLAGTLSVVLMAVSYAIGVLTNRSIFTRFPNLSPYTNLYHQLIAGFIALSVLSVLIEGVPNPTEWHPLSTVIAAELYLGCVSTSIAFFLFYRLIQEWGSVRAATVTYVIPVFALGLDLGINSHSPTASEILGVIGVTTGVIILNYPSRRT